MNTRTSVKIGSVFVISCSMSLTVTIGHSQEVTSPDKASVLDTITVVGTRESNSTVREVAASISVIDEATIADNFAFSTDPLTLLDIAVPGMTPNTNLRSTCYAKLRGRTAAFLINGVPVSQNLRFGNCSDIYNVSPYAINGIEVNRGASATYGYGAPGGIINVTTRRGLEDGENFYFAANSSFNSGDADDSFETNAYAGVGSVIGQWDFYAGFGYGSLGLEKNPNGQMLALQNEANSYSLDLSVGYQLSDTSEVAATFIYFLNDIGDFYTFGEQGEYGVVYSGPIVHFAFDTEDEAEQRNVLGTVSYKHSALFADSSLELSLFVQDQHEENRFASFFPDFADGSDDGTGWYISANASDNDRFGVRSSITTPFNKGSDAGPSTVTYGVDFTTNSSYSPFFSYTDTDTVLGFFSPEVTLDSLSVFAQFKIPVGRFTFTGGARHESYSGETTDRGAEFGFVPGDFSGFLGAGDIQDFSIELFNAGLIYDLNDSAQLYAGISQGAEISELGRAARTVSFEDPPRNVPEAIDLEPARSTQYELGSRLSHGSLYFTIAGFYSGADLTADATFDPSCTPGQGICPLIPLRQPTRVWGVEVTADYVVSDRLTIGSVATFQDGEFDDPFDSPDAGYIPTSSEIISPFRISGFSNWQISERLRTRLVGNYVASRSPYEVDDFFAWPARVNTDAYFLMDGSLAYAFEVGEVTLAASNLFDEEYVISTNVSGGPSRNIYAAGRRLSLTYTARF